MFFNTGTSDAETEDDMLNEVEELIRELTAKKEELHALKEQIRRLNADFASESIRRELKTLRNLETIRIQHEQTLSQECKVVVDCEHHKREEDSDVWQKEKCFLIEKGGTLKKYNHKKM